MTSFSVQMHTRRQDFLVLLSSLNDCNLFLRHPFRVLRCALENSRSETFISGLIFLTPLGPGDTSPKVDRIWPKSTCTSLHQERRSCTGICVFWSSHWFTKLGFIACCRENVSGKPPFFWIGCWNWSCVLILRLCQETKTCSVRFGWVDGPWFPGSVEFILNQVDICIVIVIDLMINDPTNWNLLYDGW